MVCRHFTGTTSDGKPFQVVVCSRRERTKHCKCGRAATLLCDHKLLGSKTGKTCDAPLCPRCATNIGPDRDLCPVHARMAAPARNAEAGGQRRLPGMDP
jgi:hypothetical protein